MRTTRRNLQVLVPTGLVLAGLCFLVADVAGALAPTDRYTYPDGTAASAQTVYDTATHLTWQRAVGQTGATLTSAVSYCAGLNLAGSTGWRLPAAKELASLVDVTTSSPAIDGAAFPNTPSDYFWTSTCYDGGGGCPATSGPKYVILFDDGSILFNGGADTGGIGGGQFDVRCVR